MSDNTAFRNWSVAFAATVIAVLACIAYVDRRSAMFFDHHLRQTAAWTWLDRMLAQLDIAVVMALLFLLGSGVWVLSGRSLALWAQTPLLCSWAAMWATAADIILKGIFGRAPIGPYLRGHAYGFHWLRGNPLYSAFPSGTAAISSAIAATLWIVMPRSRALSGSIVVLLCVAVVVTNYHWVSDVVAGIFLGASIGWMTVRLQSLTRVH